MEIKESTAIIALIFSSISLLLSFVIFRQSRKDKTEEKRKEIFSLILEANITCKATKSSLKQLEEQLNIYFPDEIIDLSAETQLLKSLDSDINDAIAQTKTEEKLDQDMYFLSKQLVAAVDVAYKAVQKKVEKYQVE